jgi:hypothetical protein
LQYTAPSDFGVVWPTTKGGKKVSTTAVGKKVWCAAAGEGPLADAIAKESNWRWNYPAHLVKLAEEASTSPAAALEIARRGLDALHASFQYIHSDGTRVALSTVSERDATPVVSERRACCRVCRVVSLVSACLPFYMSVFVMQASLPHHQQQRQRQQRQQHPPPPPLHTQPQ